MKPWPDTLCARDDELLTALAHSCLAEARALNLAAMAWCFATLKFQQQQAMVASDLISRRGFRWR